MGINKVIHVFIGYDPREDAAAQVCKYSLQKHASVPVRVHFLRLQQLEDEGLLPGFNLLAAISALGIIGMLRRRTH